MELEFLQIPIRMIKMQGGVFGSVANSQDLIRSLA